LAADCKDGNGCNLKTSGCWLWFVPPQFKKIIRFPSVDVLGVFRVSEKVLFNLKFSTFFLHKEKTPLDGVSLIEKWVGGGLID